MVLLRGDQREFLAKFPWAGCKMVRACIDVGRALFELGLWNGKDFDLKQLRERVGKVKMPMPRLTWRRRISDRVLRARWPGEKKSVVVATVYATGKGVIFVKAKCLRLGWTDKEFSDPYPTRDEAMNACKEYIMACLVKK